MPPRPMLRALRLLVPALLGFACAQPPYKPPFTSVVVRPGPEEAVIVENVVVIVDASGSIDRELLFPREKAVLEAFVAGMPPGTYNAGTYILGGRPDDHLPPEPFDRWDLAEHAHGLSHTSRETPLARILRGLPGTIVDAGGRSAIVIVNDGVPTRYGRYIGGGETLAVARRLIEQASGEICLHTVRLGADERGPELLRALADLTPCGSYRELPEIESARPLAAFQREIFIGPKPAPEAPRVRAMTDLDQDGVDDRFDRCARTPIGATVDERGCWVIEDYVFETGKAEIREQHRPALSEVAKVLAANPSLRVRLDGHTDDTGSTEFNFRLADARATAVLRVLLGAGIARERLEVRSFGPTRPIASNGTPEGRTRNRRVELSVVDW